MKIIKVKARDLQLGDVVVLEAINAYHTATVKKIAEGLVTFLRPYTQTADFTCGSNVICYIGIEEFAVSAGDYEYDLVERKVLK